MVIGHSLILFVCLTFNFYPSIYVLLNVRLTVTACTLYTVHFIDAENGKTHMQ